MSILNKIKKYRLSPEEYAKYLGVKIGKNCYISTKNFSSEAYLIEIGDNTRIASGVSFYTHGALWPFRKTYKVVKDLDYFGKIKIGNNVHIGEDAKIMPGVIIEDNCIIGAGSIVTKSVPTGKIVAGNPAKIIGEVNDFIDKISKIGVKVKQLSLIDKKKYLLSVDENRFVKKGYMKM